MVSLRFKLYRWMFDRPGTVPRWIIINFLIMATFSLLTAYADYSVGALELRWGLTVWMSFTMGFAAVCIFNVAVNLLGLGYQEWKEQSK